MKFCINSAALWSPLPIASMIMQCFEQAPQASLACFYTRKLSKKQENELSFLGPSQQICKTTQRINCISIGLVRPLPRSRNVKVF